MNYIKEYARSLSLSKSESGRQFLADMEEILSKKEIENMMVYRHHMRVNRYQHLLSVSYLSYVATKREGLNYIETAKAAMMHDLFYYDYKDKIKYPKRHNYIHPDTALLNAEKIMQLSDLQKEIIRSHMWPLVSPKPNSKEAKIVCKMDKICSVLECIYSVFSGKKKHISNTETKGDNACD